MNDVFILYYVLLYHVILLIKPWLLSHKISYLINTLAILYCVALQKFNMENGPFNRKSNN